MPVKSSKFEIKKTQQRLRRPACSFWSASSGEVFSANPDGSDLKVIVSEGRRLPDGIVVDVAAVISTGPTWATPSPMTVPSSVRTLTGQTYPHCSSGRHVHSQATATR